MAAFIFSDLKVQQLADHAAEIGSAYRKYGVVVFPGILTKDPLFLEYLSDVHRALDHILAKEMMQVKSEECLDLKLGRLLKKAELGKLLADLGTQPVKLMSGNVLKFRPEFTNLAKICLGADSFIGTPAAGDTLHLYLPTEKFHKYNLPIHQDYQYLMQSPSQATFWINLGKRRDNVGGITFWLGSQNEGIAMSRRNEEKQFEVVASQSQQDKYETFDLVGDEGDLVIMNSLTWHQSNKNYSKEFSRVVQLFRFSDLNHEQSMDSYWQSTTYPRPNLRYENAHPELFVETPTMSSESALAQA